MGVSLVWLPAWLSPQCPHPLSQTPRHRQTYPSRPSPHSRRTLRSEDIQVLENATPGQLSLVVRVLVPALPLTRSLQTLALLCPLPRHVNLHPSVPSVLRPPPPFFLFFVFLGLHLRHLEIPRLEVESQLYLPACTTATAMQDPSLVCDLYHRSQQRQILNSLSEARD